MAKISYKVPASLNTSSMDVEISIQNSEGVGTKPLTLRQISMIGVSGMLLALILTKTFFAQGGLIYQILFAFLWFLTSVLLLRRDAADLYYLSYVITAMNYLPKNARKILTRRDNKVNDFLKICNIEKIDRKTGLITFLDGTIGYLYQVVGSASALLFDDDRDRILDRCDLFYRKLAPEVESIIITLKEPQKIDRQAANLKHLYDEIGVIDEDLAALIDSNYRHLRNEVGGNYRSIHQYFILKAENKESLIQAKNVLQAEVESSNLVFKSCLPMFDNDLYQIFATIYKK